MDEINAQDEIRFKDAFESSLVTLRNGDVVRGRVIGFNNKEVYVDLGFKCDGVISKEEFSDDPEIIFSKTINIGDEVEVLVLKVSDGEGNVALSKKRADAIKTLKKLEEIYNNKEIIKVTVFDVIKGGLLSSLGGVRIFIPASQISSKYIKDLNDFKKQELDVRIIEFDIKKKKVVASAKIVAEENKINNSINIWENIEVGKSYMGVVKNLTNYGAFIDIGGIDGLIHISELDWNKIKHPSEILKVGENIEVIVIDFDKDKKKISLRYKKQEDNPWNKIGARFNVGDIITGKVLRNVPFGAFIDLGDGIDGLVHISQISNTRISKVDDVLKVGQEVKAKITQIDIENRKINLSIKEIESI